MFWSKKRSKKSEQRMSQSHRTHGRRLLFEGLESREVLSGVVAVDQSGPGAGLKRTRLYVYPDVDSRTLHLITVGDKSSQGADIKFSREFVAGLLKQEEGERKSDSEGG